MDCEGLWSRHLEVVALDLESPRELDVDIKGPQLGHCGVASLLIGSPKKVLSNPERSLVP